MRILIGMEIEPSGEYDILTRTDSKEWLRIVNSTLGGYCFNTGNKLWFQGIVSEIDTEENEIVFYQSGMTHDYVNVSFDIIVAPMANIFAVENYKLMDRVAESFEKYRIPIYVIACGVQAESYDKLDELIQVIRKPSERLIRAVYQSGGEFALRGNFTKEFFNRLGFNSAVVTGCPSLYQLGRDLPQRIEQNSKRRQAPFRPVFNGQLHHYDNLMRKYPNSVFMDQGHYYRILNNPESIPDKYSIKLLFMLYKAIPWQVLEGRVALFPDMDLWYSYLHNEGFTFSFGERIHGNIMALLAGVPAMVYACDSRTKEMAEFFEIPIYTGKNAPDNLERVYQEADYSGFVSSFGRKYDAFESFLVGHGIVKRMNCNNRFLKDCDSGIICDNWEKLSTLKYEMDGKKKVLQAIDFCRSFCGR